MFTGTHLETACFINSRPLWISADVNQIHLSVPQPITWPMAEAALIIWFAYQACTQTGWEQSILPPIWTHFTSEFLSYSQSPSKKECAPGVCLLQQLLGANRLWSSPLAAYSWIVKTKILPVKEGNREKPHSDLSWSACWEMNAPSRACVQTKERFPGILTCVSSVDKENLEFPIKTLKKCILTLVYIKQMTKDLLYSPGNSTQ